MHSIVHFDPDAVLGGGEAHSQHEPEFVNRKTIAKIMTGFESQGNFRIAQANAATINWAVN
jgi:hypothetical protein